MARHGRRTSHSKYTYSENNNCKHDDDDVRDGIEIFKEKKM